MIRVGQIYGACPESQDKCAKILDASPHYIIAFIANYAQIV
jgi:hypothetical protein